MRFYKRNRNNTPFLKRKNTTLDTKTLLSLEKDELFQFFRSQTKDERNVMRTTSLFWEVRKDRSEDADFFPLFTLKEDDHEVDGLYLFSLKKIYLSYDHVPGLEYDFAKDVLGSWEHWLKLVKSSMRHEFQSWRDELDVRIKAEALRSLMQASRAPDARGVTAAKYLADKGYSDKRTAGRPSTEEVERQKKIAVDVQNNLASDMERLGLKVVG